MANDENETWMQLLSITRDFLHELEAERALRAITLDASLERDLGIDSLGESSFFIALKKHLGFNYPKRRWQK